MLEFIVLFNLIFCWPKCVCCALKLLTAGLICNGFCSLYSDYATSQQFFQWSPLPLSKCNSQWFLFSDPTHQIFFQNMFSYSHPKEDLSLKVCNIFFALSLCKIQSKFVRWPIKGQMISECPYEIIVCPKIATKKFPRFLPWPQRRGQIKNFIKPIMLNNP